jgi:hypothetical protein
LTDGAFTEANGKDVTDGMAVVVGEMTKEDKASASAERSPLMPQPMGRGQQGQTGQTSPDNPGAARER